MFHRENERCKLVKPCSIYLTLKIEIIFLLNVLRKNNEYSNYPRNFIQDYFLFVVYHMIGRSSSTFFSLHSPFMTETRSFSMKNCHQLYDFSVSIEPIYWNQQNRETPASSNFFCSLSEKIFKNWSVYVRASFLFSFAIDPFLNSLLLVACTLYITLWYKHKFPIIRIIFNRWINIRCRIKTQHPAPNETNK